MDDNMNLEDLDLVELQDDQGNTMTMEVLDYFFYEGKEYAIMTDYDENSACNGCDQGSCEGCEDQKQDVIIMEVRPVGDEEEEFVPVEDDELYDKLSDFVNNGMYLEDDDEEYGEYADEEDDK